MENPEQLRDLTDGMNNLFQNYPSRDRESNLGVFNSKTVLFLPARTNLILFI